MGRTILALLLVFLSTSVSADNGNIARCLDENGDLTYSDFYCTTYENGNPLLMTEQSINQPIRLDSPRSRQQRDSADIKKVEKMLIHFYDQKSKDWIQDKFPDKCYE